LPDRGPIRLLGAYPGEWAPHRAAVAKAAREVQRRLHALMEINFVESNPGPVKAAMSLMGLLEPAFRLPAVYPRPESVRKIEKILLGLGLIPESPEAEETAVENRLAV
jgi:dihydrodipicolinate synthase/N-acetylneuraminate lyase